MQHLIAEYLFQYKTCPLPGLGTLWVKAGKAETDFLNTSIKAPEPSIIFKSSETEADKLIDFIATKKSINIHQAIETLGQFGNNLKGNIITGNDATLDGIGSFLADGSGNIQFKQAALPTVFLQPVKAQRVIHPQAEHNILVGDTQTTNTEMTEYYSDELIAVHKNRWWIWAIVLGAIALVALLFYINNPGHSSTWGNAISIKYL
jgi:hypothetical protein